MEQRRCISCMKQIDSAVCPHCGYPTKQQNEEHQLPVGYTLRERYQIGKVLGQGGFGITYLAWDNLLEQPVAVKEFYPRGSVYRNSASTVRLECVTRDVIPHYEYTKERFLREAKALVRFRNIPEIVDILDFVNENNTAYIIMEYVKGASLETYIARRGGKLSVEETFRILRPVMEALAKVHKGGIIHRDISPDNIILDPMGGAKLLDFGAVRSVENPGVDKALTHSTEAILKHGFAPMEQYNSRGTLGPWTDEYAMCGTVWYCLTGTVPPEAALRMTEGIDPDWSSIPGLAEYRQKALEKGFSSRPRDRYPDLDSLIEALFPAEAEVPKPVTASIPERKPEPAAPAPMKTAAVQPPAVPQPVAAEAPKTAPPAPAAMENKTVYADASPAYVPPKAEPVMADAPRESVPSERKAPSFIRKKPVWIAALLAIVLIAAIIGISRLPGSRYKKAEKLMAQGNYAEAMEIFETLGDFRDSEEMAEECSNRQSYNQAIVLMNQGAYDEAAAIFESLGDYLDSPALLVECRNREAIAQEEVHAQAYAQAEAYLEKGHYFQAAVSFYSLGDYSDAWERSVDCWSHFQPQTISAGFNHTVGLQADGTVVAVGNNEDGQCDVSEWRDIVAICTGGSTFGAHTIGLKADGTVVAVGNNDWGKCNVSEWQNIISVSTGNNHTVGLKADGTVVAVGNNRYGQCDVSGWRDIVAISAGINHTVGLKADGTVVAVGDNDWGKCNVFMWQNIISVSTGNNHTVGLKADGTVVAVGRNYSEVLVDGTWVEGYGQCNVSGWQDIVAISAGDFYTVGLKADGTVVAVGLNYIGQCDVSGWRDIVAISAGIGHTVGLKADGTVVAVGNNFFGECDVDGWRDIRIYE